MGSSTGDFDYGVNVHLDVGERNLSQKVEDNFVLSDSIFR